MASVRERTPINDLYFITMDDAPLTHLQQVEAACRAGIQLIQLRMKLADNAAFREVAGAAKQICDEWGVRLIINDRVEVAREVGAYGVHLGKEDMTVAEARVILGEDFVIGGTANTIEDIRLHYSQGADYIGLGPYRWTGTKKNLSPILGLEGYQDSHWILLDYGSVIIHLFDAKQRDYYQLEDLWAGAVRVER